MCTCVHQGSKLYKVINPALKTKSFVSLYCYLTMSHHVLHSLKGLYENVTEICHWNAAYNIRKCQNLNRIIILKDQNLRQI